MSSSVSNSPLSLAAAGGSPRPKPRIITRTRRMLSCAACRSRRLKCDRRHPRCSRCIAGGSTACVYVEDPKGPSESARKKRVSVTRRRESGTLLPHNILCNAPDRDAEIIQAIGDQSVGHLTTSVGGRSKYVGATFWACVGAMVSGGPMKHIHLLPELSNRAH